MKRILLVAVAATAELINAPLHAQELFFFSAPSKNINCVYDSGSPATGKASLRCDLGQFTPSLKTVPPQSKEDIEIFGRCTLPKMRAFVIEKDARATATYCPTDAPISAEQTILGYGSRIERGGFSCASETSGMTCQNNLGHGFSLSRNLQRVF